MIQLIELVSLGYDVQCSYNFSSWDKCSVETNVQFKQVFLQLGQVFSRVIEVLCLLLASVPNALRGLISCTASAEASAEQTCSQLQDKPQLQFALFVGKQC